MSGFLNISYNMYQFVTYIDQSISANTSKLLFEKGELLLNRKEVAFVLINICWPEIAFYEQVPPFRIVNFGYSNIIYKKILLT
jgi:hypothetical protein